MFPRIYHGAISAKGITSSVGGGGGGDNPRRQNPLGTPAYRETNTFILDNSSYTSDSKYLSCSVVTFHVVNDYVDVFNTLINIETTDNMEMEIFNLVVQYP